ncbi:MAG: 6-phosphogluconolactonase, partial [Acidobacteria bacterium]
MNSSPNIRILPDRAALFQAAADEFVRQANAAIASKGRFTVALAGGSTPKGLYSLLATKAALPW